MPSILSGDEISRLVQKVTNVENIREQIQPAGFDVTVNRILSYPCSKFTLGIKKGENSALSELPLIDGYYELDKGAYFVDLDEITTIPKDGIGILLPRSTLLRNGIDVRTALFDPGYSGQPKVMLVCHRPARIERFARIGQLIILRTEREFTSQYGGQYQGERATSR